ncbi:MAG TPA: 2-phospho-L-lactate transferase [Candidatus Methanofastidiosa archaeon]|nr:2-phospho-L-lactate transferase [Candidatus Methanofastidiosa archaeon]
MLLMLTFFSGGTGTPKLLMGMKRLLGPEDICVVANTGEDLVQSGVHISPDIDSVIYALADIIDRERWYGQKGDTYRTNEALSKLGYNEMLRLGDKDRATKIYRTLLLSSGLSLTDATKRICESLGVRENVFPMSDETVTTTIIAEHGPMAFHEYWVRDRAMHRVDEVKYIGSETASLPSGAMASIECSDAIIIGPSNPITSIGPILSIRDAYNLCKEKYTLAISPFIGNTPFSGPAGRLMADLGRDVSPIGVADAYEGLLDAIVIDRADEAYAKALEDRGLDVLRADIAMKDLYKSKALGMNILDFLVIN